MSARDLHDVETLLRDATREYTDTIEPAHDAWERVEARAQGAPGRRRARTGAVLAVAGAATVAAAVLGALALTDDDDLRVETPPATDTPGTTDAPPPTQAPVVDRRPAIATSDRRDDGSIVVGTVGEGGPAQIASQSPGPPGTEVVAIQGREPGDAPAVSYLRIDEGGGPCGTLFDMDFGRPAVERVAATAFAYSPSGMRLAYATRGSGCDPQSRISHLVVRTGEEERVWTHEPGLDDDLALYVDSIAWSPDGTRLAVGLCYEGCSVAVLDDPGGDGGRLLDLRVVAEGRLPTWLDDGRLAFVVGPETSGGVEQPVVHVVRTVHLDGDDSLDTLIPPDVLGTTAVSSLEADAASGLVLLRYVDGRVVEWDGTRLRDFASDTSAAAYVTLPT